MFDIGFAELLIVAVVALIVVGPERMPAAIRTVGLWVGRIRRTLGNVQREISEELRVDEMRREAKAQQEALEKQVDGLKKPFNESLREDMLISKPPEPSNTAGSESPDKPADRKSVAE